MIFVQLDFVTLDPEIEKYEQILCAIDSVVFLIFIFVYLSKMANINQMYVQISNNLRHNKRTYRFLLDYKEYYFTENCYEVDPLRTHIKNRMENIFGTSKSNQFEGRNDIYLIFSNYLMNYFDGDMSKYAVEY